MAQDDTSRPVFVLGGQRSGTTLMRLMLDAHPDLAIGPESGFLRGANDALRIRDFHEGEGWYERFGVDRPWMTSRLAALYDELFSSYAASFGKARWGEKTPLHLWHVRLVLELFPDALFVGVVRHPAAVVASVGNWGHDAEFAAAAWAEGVHRQLRDRDEVGADRYLLLRYEDLLRDAPATMRAVLSHCGLQWSDDVLRHHEVHAQRGSPEVTDGGTRPGDAIDPARADAWRDRIDEGDLEQVMELAEPWAGLLGYRADGTAPADAAPALPPGGLDDVGWPDPPPPAAQFAEMGWLEKTRSETAGLRDQVRTLTAERDEARARARTAEAQAASAIANYEALNNRRFVRLGRKLLDR